MSQIVYVVSGKTESGDRITPSVFNHRPTDEDLTILAYSIDPPSDRNRGPGYAGSYCHFEIDECLINDH